MYSLERARVLLVVAALAFLSTPTLAAITELNFRASDQSWVATGLSVNVAPALGNTFSGSYSGDELLFSVVSLEHDWTLDIMAPDGQPLAVGDYTNTAHPPFMAAGQPGLAFFGDGRIDNQDSGFFSVRELSIDDIGAVQKLAVDFTQYGEGNQDWWLKGQLRYNSSIPVVPEPSTALTLVLGLPIVLYLRRSRPSKPSIV
jgi:hypothetical protein